MVCLCMGDMRATDLLLNGPLQPLHCIDAELAPLLCSAVLCVCCGSPVRVFTHVKCPSPRRPHRVTSLTNTDVV